MYEYVFWIAVWSIVNMLVRAANHVPECIQRIPDQFEAAKKSVIYQNHFLSLIHATVALALCKLPTKHQQDTV